MICSGTTMCQHRSPRHRINLIVTGAIREGSAFLDKIVHPWRVRQVDVPGPRSGLAQFGTSARAVGTGSVRAGTGRRGRQGQNETDEQLHAGMIAALGPQRRAHLILRGRPRFRATGSLVLTSPTARSADNAESIEDRCRSRLATISLKLPAEVAGFGVLSVIALPLFGAFAHVPRFFGCALRMCDASPAPWDEVFGQNGQCKSCLGM